MEIKELDNNKEKIEIIENLEESLKREIPVGYLRMELSTKGLLGAPKLFHVRGFDTKEILELSMTADSELPLKLSGILNSLIYEEDVQVEKFHEKEVIELLVKLFTLFYERNLELDFPWNEEDIQFLKEHGKASLIKDLRAGIYKPKVMIDLAKLKYYDVDPNSIKSYVEIYSKKNNFFVKFSYPKFGDAIIVKKYLSSAYKEKDQEFANIHKKLEIRQRYYSELDDSNEEIDIRKLPYISKEELDAYKEYEIKKALFAIDLVRALHLIEFNGEDLSKASLSDKIRYISDPRINHNVTKIIENEFQKMEFGINPDIEIVNPFTQKREVRRFLFRLMDILQAFKEFDSDEYAVRYD